MHAQKVTVNRNALLIQRRRHGEQTRGNASGSRRLAIGGRVEMREKVFSRGWELLLLRLIVGFGFAAHGYAKLHRGPEKFAVILTALGVPQPHLTSWTTSLLEFIGGVSLMAGAFVRALSVPLIMVMLTALIKVHMQYGFSSVTLRSVSASGAEFGPVGYELNLLYIAGLVSLAVSRPSALSVDAWLKKRKRTSRRVAATRDRE